MKARDTLWLDRVLAVLPLILTAAPLAAASYYNLDDAQRLYERGAFAEAATVYQQLAAEGHAQAEYRLGRMTAHGQGLPLDPQAACDWYERAANQDHLAAIYELGNCFLTGEGRPVDRDQAIYLLGMAAENGQVDAQYRLARMYASGNGVSKNPERAYIYLFLALRGDLDQAPMLKSSLEAELDDHQLQRAQAFALKLLQRQQREARPDAR